MRTLGYQSLIGERSTPCPPLSLVGDGEDGVGERGKVGGEALDHGRVDCGTESGNKSSESPLTGDCVEGFRRWPGAPGWVSRASVMS